MSNKKTSRAPNKKARNKKKKRAANEKSPGKKRGRHKQRTKTHPKTI
jgi:hypothetical protein